MSSTALTERTATYRSADGLELFYRDFGDPAARGTPVVCLPGLTRNSRDFIKLATRLSAQRRVICPDVVFPPMTRPTPTMCPAPM